MLVERHCPAYNPPTMWRIKVSLLLTLSLLLGPLTLQSAMADVANNPSLTISQLKITSGSGQFITLRNMTDLSLDMSRYQLQYFNNFDLAKATSSRLIGLSGTLPPHGYFMVNDNAMLMCYQLTVESVSLGLSSTAGLIEVLAFNQASPGGAVAPVLQDYMGWAKTAATGAQTLPTTPNAFLQRSADAVLPGSGNWQTVQPDTSNSCELVSLAGSTVTPADIDLLTDPTPPPVSIISVDAATAPAIPLSDIGLMAPQINEVLPNPGGSGNDTTDEFIELYNPNSRSFDLSGFVLQTGLTTPRKYVFPAGTSLPATSFVAFYSETTGLSLSNTSSQAVLLDPTGNSISASDVYKNAKDGQSWSLAKGKWYWTMSVTPNAANVIKQPAVSKKSATSSKAGKTLNAKKTAGDYASSDQPASTPVHTKTLAVVGAAALLYGAYEYRVDLVNKFYQLRRNFSGRFRNRAST